MFAELGEFFMRDQMMEQIDRLVDVGITRKDAIVYLLNALDNMPEEISNDDLIGVCVHMKMSADVMIERRKNRR